MQPTNRSSRILLPVKLWFVYLSLFAALGLEYIPSGRTPGLPDWVALVLVFWSIREPRYVGMGVGFLCGLAMDVADVGLMGQHPLAYVVISYLAAALSKRILWFPIGQQSLYILPLLLLAQAIQLVVRAMPGVELPGLAYFAGPFIASALWLPLTFVLLMPQYRPIEHDANRPI